MGSEGPTATQRTAITAERASERSGLTKQSRESGCERSQVIRLLGDELHDAVSQGNNRLEEDQALHLAEGKL